MSRGRSEPSSGSERTLFELAQAQLYGNCAIPGLYDISLDERMNNGGFNEIYRGTATLSVGEHLGERVKIVAKVRLPHLFNDPEHFDEATCEDYRLLFCNELDHHTRAQEALAQTPYAQNIVNCYGGGIFAQQQELPIGILLLSNYSVANTLSEVRGRVTHLPPSEIVDYALQLAHTLQTTTKAGILHLDLKPENLLVTPTDEGKVVRLFDFGISRRMGEEPDNGLIFASPAYCAPEQVLGADLSEKTESWGVGAILYYLITGTAVRDDAPWPLTAEAAVEPVLASRIDRAQVPIELKQLTLRSLEINDAPRPSLSTIINGLSEIQEQMRGGEVVGLQLDALSGGEDARATVRLPRHV